MTTPDEPKPRVKDLDEHANLWNRYRQCEELEASWKREKELAKARLIELVGEAEEARINGETVFTYARENRFRSADFQKDYPDMYKLYVHTVAKDVFDADAFELTRPELFAQYQTRSFRASK